MSKEDKKGSLGQGIDRFLRSGLKREEPQPKVEPPKKEKTKKVFSVWLEPAVIRQLKLIAAEEGKTQESLVNEAMNFLFKEYNKPEIAPKEEV